MKTVASMATGLTVALVVSLCAFAGEKPPCPECNDSGKIVKRCEACHSTGGTVCTVCRGASPKGGEKALGVIACPDCAGQGRIKSPSGGFLQCKRCLGVRAFRCPACVKGWVVCQICKGDKFTSTPCARCATLVTPRTLVMKYTYFWGTGTVYADHTCLAVGYRPADGRVEGTWSLKNGNLVVSWATSDKLQETITQHEGALRIVGTRPGSNQTTPAKLIEGVYPVEVKPVEVKPVEVKPVEVKPVDTQRGPDEDF